MGHGIGQWYAGRLRGVMKEEAGEEELLTAPEWVRAEPGFEADATQAKVLDSEGKGVILNCTRQWGKSTVTAARAVMEAGR